jgi:hypothetical protein
MVVHRCIGRVNPFYFFIVHTFSIVVFYSFHTPAKTIELVTSNSLRQGIINDGENPDFFGGLGTAHLQIPNGKIIYRSRKRESTIHNHKYLI